MPLRVFVVCSFLLSLTAVVRSEPAQLSETQSKLLIQTVKRVMRTEPEWVSVHAAEALIRHGHAADARVFFRNKVDSTGPKFRIGVWRVMARSAPSAAEREKYTGRIRAAFLDKAGPDRLHAIETLAKLGADVRSPELERVAAGSDAMAAFASWCQWNMKKKGAEASLARLLVSADERAPYCAAYSLRHLPSVSMATRARLKQGLARAPEDSAARGYFLSALFVHSSGRERARFRKQLIDYALGRDKVAKDELCAALGAVRLNENKALLWTLFNQDNADVRVFAADALLTMQQ